MSDAQDVEIARLQEQVKAADKALQLAERLAQFRTGLIISTILSLVAIGIALFKHP